MTIAVLDIGKTNVKLLVCAADGSTIEQVSRPNEVLSSPPYPHFDTDKMFDWFLDQLRDQAGRHKIERIVPVAHGAAAVVVAGKGLALPMLDYEFDGPDELAADYDALLDPFHLSFSPRLGKGLNLGRQLYWQARTFSEAFAAADAILMYPQYWAWRLSGVARSDVTSLGCHTDLWRPGEARFSGLVERLAWREKFPPFAKAWDVIGTLTPDLAERTALDPQTKIVCGIHDSNASLLPALLTEEKPFTVVSTGTWVITMAVGGALDRLDEAKDCLANVDVTGEPVPTARFMGGRIFAEQRDTGISEVEASDDAARRTADALALLDARGPILIDGPFATNRRFLQRLQALRSGQEIKISAQPVGSAQGAALLGAWPNSRPAHRFEVFS
ncbi:MAG: FGGY-family carbohydrate kinase [Geminicoccaceae bacterium]